MNRPMYRIGRRCRRGGAALVEGAIVVGVLITILIGSLDLSLAVIRQNSITEAARRVARAAIVRGDSSSGILTSWGPAMVEGTADENSDQAEAIRKVLVAVKPSDVRFQVTWPDGDHASGDRVEVEITSDYQPILMSLFGRDPFRLNAQATMRIEH